MQMRSAPNSVSQGDNVRFLFFLFCFSRGGIFPGAALFILRRGCGAREIRENITWPKLCHCSTGLAPCSTRCLADNTTVFNWENSRLLKGVTCREERARQGDCRERECEKEFESGVSQLLGRSVSKHSRRTCDERGMNEGGH